MTLFTQIEETENCHFGRIWKPPTKKRKKYPAESGQKRNKKTKKKRAKRYPLKADFAVFIIF